MAPAWLTVVAWLYLSVWFCCAGIIAYDIAVKRRRQPVGVMNFVFPITALYFGPFALALYWRWDRAAARTAMPPVSMSSAAVSRAAAASARGGMQMGGHAHLDMAGAARSDGTDEPGSSGGRARPWWVTMAIEVSHCGSGCTLGDVISEFAIFALASRSLASPWELNTSATTFSLLRSASSSSISQSRRCAASGSRMA